MNESIGIREFQHFLYCPHRWGLIRINDSWAENAYVVKANIMHETVHYLGDIRRKSIRKLYSLPIYWDEYDLYGKLDYAEIEGHTFKIIEYKPSSHSLRSDEMQLFLQKKCVEYIYGNTYNVECYFFYDDIRRRILVTFDEDEMFKSFISLRSEMLHYIEKGIVPPIAKNQYCSGCSMKDMCLPKTKVLNLTKRIQKSFNADFM